MGKGPFSYRIAKNGKLLVHWHGKNGKREIVIKGVRAEKLISELPIMDQEQQQLALARATGNFKRGNERLASTLNFVVTQTVRSTNKLKC
jgi:hypothetical protein